jgi:streptogramin lyase
VAGTGVSGSSGNDGPAVDAQVNPSEIAIGPGGDLYFDDTNNYRTIDPQGIIHAFAGTGVPGFSGDGGPAVDATFGEGVNGIATDAAGDVYLGDPGNHRIRKVDPAGIITTIAGSGEAGSSGDGRPALEAALDSPHSMALDADGSLYFVDDAANVVRRIDPDGIISTIAGAGTAGYSGDCGPATAAQLDGPSAITLHDGVLYILDSGNGRIRVIVP